MLSLHLRDGNERKEALVQELARVESNTRASAGALSDALLERANAKAREVYEMQRRIDSALRSVEAELNVLRISRARWSALTTGVSDAVKDGGDLGNWASVLARDSKELMECAKRIALENENEDTRLSE